MVDFNRLSRNYNNFPLLKGEEIPLEDLKYLFFELNFSRDEVASFLNISVSKVRKYLTKYGLKKTLEMQQDKVKKANLAKYGVEFPLQRKDIRDKASNTVKERYGVDNPFQADFVKDTSKQTLLKKYGVDNIQKCKETREKTKRTNLERYGNKYAIASDKVVSKIVEHNKEKYGVEYPFQNKDILNKTRNTCIEKYGTENPFSSKEVQEKIKSTNKEKYGYEYAIQNPEILSKSRKTLYGLNGPTKPEKVFEDMLIKRGVSGIEHQFCINNHSYDLKVGNILIEINPTETHNVTINFAHLSKICKEEGNFCSKHKPLRKDNHLVKWLLAKENGFELITIFDWMDKEKVADFVSSKVLPVTKVFARKCIIKEVSKCNATKFVNENHVMGWDRGSLNLGLYYKDELVSLMTFGKPRFNREYEWELLRYCTLKHISVTGGAQKLFKYFVTEYNPKSIITYSNNNLGNGTVYNRLGFSECEKSKPSCVWVHLKTKFFVRHMSLIMQGADRLLESKIEGYFNVGLDRDDFVLRGGKEEYKEEYSKLPENTEWWPNNIDIVKHYGFVQVYDCGSTKWEYLRESNKELLLYEK